MATRRPHDNSAMLLGSVILAGGRSRRMGRPKESLPIAGNTLLGLRDRWLKLRVGAVASGGER